MTTIRAAHSQDIDDLVYLLSRMHAESRFSVLPYAPEKVHEMLTAILAGLGCIFVVEQDGKITGTLVGLLTPQWFSHALVAEDLVCYIAPEHRGGMAAARLVRRFIDWAKSQNAQMTSLGASTGVETERTAMLYERLGGAHSGVVYTWGTA
jgi:RimJ/RimL family protein N-acetyltransferase